MRQERNEPIEAKLIDLHLGELDPAEAQQVRDAIAASPELSKQNAALALLLGALGTAPVAEPPADLTASVMARIESQTQVIPFPEAQSAVPAGSARDLTASPMMSLRELVAIAACITLFVGIFVPGYYKAQNVASRNLCLNRIRQIGTALASYSQSNDGFLPYSNYVQGASVIPTQNRRVARASNTQPIFQMFQQGHVASNDIRVFICPSSPNGRPMLCEDYEGFNDFAEPANVSFSFQYMNLPQGRRLEDMPGRMALMADRNPIFDARRATHKLSPYEQWNSLAHEQGAGQNVLFASGAGNWATSPQVGVNGDNIYQAAGHEGVNYDGTETPNGNTDTWLVP